MYGRLLVPMGVWRMVDKRLLPQARWWMKDTFFLYATHFAFVRLVNKTMARIFPGSAIGAALLYALMPALCLGFALAGASGPRPPCAAAVEASHRRAGRARLICGGRTVNIRKISGFYLHIFGKTCMMERKISENDGRSAYGKDL